MNYINDVEYAYSYCPAIQKQTTIKIFYHKNSNNRYASYFSGFHCVNHERCPYRCSIQYHENHDTFTITVNK